VNPEGPKEVVLDKDTQYEVLAELADWQVAQLLLGTRAGDGSGRERRPNKRACTPTGDGLGQTREAAAAAAGREGGAELCALL